MLAAKARRPVAEQPNTSEPYVFLSYASAEQEQALTVSEALQQAGIAVWLDRHAIAGGSAWSTAIVRGIANCAVFVVLGSARAFRSPNVQRELNLAVEENRPLLPLLLEQAPAPDEVRYALAGRQWVALVDRARGLAARGAARAGGARGGIGPVAGTGGPRGGARHAAGDRGAGPCIGAQQPHQPARRADQLPWPRRGACRPRPAAGSQPASDARRPRRHRQDAAGVAGRGRAARRLPGRRLLRRPDAAGRPHARALRGRTGARGAGAGRDAGARQRRPLPARQTAAATLG